MKIITDKNITLKEDNGAIEITYDGLSLKFKNLSEMVDSFLPGVIRTAYNNKYLSEMVFESNKKSLFTARVFGDYEAEFVIVARNQKEAELRFDNYINENYMDVEYYVDSEVYIEKELIPKYLKKKIGVYELE